MNKTRHRPSASGKLSFTTQLNSVIRVSMWLIHWAAHIMLPIELLFHPLKLNLVVSLALWLIITQLSSRVTKWSSDTCARHRRRHEPATSTEVDLLIFGKTLSHAADIIVPVFLLLIADTWWPLSSTQVITGLSALTVFGLLNAQLRQVLERRIHALLGHIAIANARAELEEITRRQRQAQ